MKLTPKQHRAWEKARAWHNSEEATSVVVHVVVPDKELWWKAHGKLTKTQQSSSWATTVYLPAFVDDNGMILLGVRTCMLAEALPVLKQALAKAGVLAVSRIDVTDYEDCTMRNFHPLTAASLDSWASRIRR